MYEKYTAPIIQNHEKTFVKELSEQIAKEMEISLRTVRYHIDQICRKLQAKNKTDAVAITLRNGLANITKKP